MTTYTPARHAARPLGAHAATPVAPRPTHGFDATRGLSAMLLAAMVSALIVVADQLIVTWVDGHLMVAWVALWVVAFTAMALFAGSAHKVAVTTMAALDAWSQRVAKQRADQRMWHIAQSDPRLMAELQAARQRAAR